MSREQVCIEQLECDNSEITINCWNEQQTAIETGTASDYLPTCNDTNPEYYDGCQCTDNYCWCVDIYGTKIHGKALKFGGDMSYKQICLSELQCDNTKITLDDDSNNAFEISDISDNEQMIFSSEPYIHNDLGINLTFGAIFLILFAIFIIVYGIGLWRQNNQKKEN